uniref:Zgc:195075 n=1 Tax=Sinocyclocheilus grahami TaxID=75366 RepID=A0A672MYL0_SINGR
MFLFQTAKVSKPERKKLLFGKTGYGKSRAGNTILREKTQCERRQRKVHGRKITVIDTPGFFDTDHNDEETKSEIVKSLIECAPAVDAFIIVLKVGRHTRHENEVVQKFLNTLNENALKHAVILFTFGDQLEGKTVKEFVKASSQLQELVDKCGGRCHVIDNKYWKTRIWGNKSNKVHVKNLLETIDKMLLQKLEEHIQEVEKNISVDNLSPEEIREKAKEMQRKLFMKKILKQLVGAATGAVIGALLGACVALAFIYALSKPLKICIAKRSVVKAAEEADSVCDAMIKAAQLNYKNATKVREFIAFVLKDNRM